MHILVGLVALVLVFWGTFQSVEQQFQGFFNQAALVLVGGGPLAVSLFSFDFRSIADALRRLGYAVRFGGGQDQRALTEDLYAFGRMMREGRTADAGRILADPQTHPFLRELGPLVVQRAGADAISETIGTVTFARAQRVKRAEEFFLTLARVSPAMGMTGTVIGMIQLLSNLSQFDKLGAGMAVAMITTLYGLIMQHCLYTPIARKIDTYGRRLTVNLRLLERGLVAISTGRPLHDLRLLAGESEGSGGDSEVEAA